MSASHLHATPVVQRIEHHWIARIILVAALMVLSVPGVLATVSAQGEPGATPGSEAVAPSAMFAGGAAHTGEQPGPAPAGVPVPLWIFATGDTFVGATSAVVSPELGLVFTSSNAVYALDIATGQQVWSFSADLGFVSPLTVADGVLYASGEDGAVYAFDPATGALIWRSPLTDGTPVDGGPLAIGDTLVVTTWQGNIHGLNAGTGTVTWTTPIGGISFGQPAAAGGIVVVPAPTTSDMAFDGVLALDAATGAISWRFQTPTPVRPMPAISGGLVYLGDDDGTLYAVDLATGVQRWTAGTSSPISAAPAIAGGVVYVPGGSTLSAWDAATGTALWTAPISATEVGGTTVTPTGAGGRLVLVGDGTGALHAFDPSGAEVWTVTVAGAALNHWPFTVVDGVIYASAQDGSLYALAAQPPASDTPPAPTPTTGVPSRPGDLGLPPAKGSEAQAPPPTQAPTPPPVPTPTPVPTAPVAYADAGMVEPGHYVSPNTGVEMRWDTTGWELDRYVDPPVSSTYEGDELHLAWTTDDNILIGVYIFPTHGATIEDIVTYASSPGNVADAFGPNAAVVLSTATATRGAIVTRDTGSGFATWMYYSELYLVNDGTAFVAVELVAPVPLAEEVLIDVQAQVTLNGQPVMTFYPIADVLAVVGP